MLSRDEVYGIIVGRTLRAERKKFKLDQDLLAERIGLSQPGVSKIERLGRCGVPMLYKYCIAIETTPERIIDSASSLMRGALDGAKDGDMDWDTKGVANWCDDVFAEWAKEESGEVEVAEDISPIVIDESFDE